MCSCCCVEAKQKPKYELRNVYETILAVYYFLIYSVFQLALNRKYYFLVGNIN